jgi:hypothetical protein
MVYTINDTRIAVVVDLDTETILTTLTNTMIKGDYVKTFIDSNSQFILILTDNGNFQIFSLVTFEWVHIISISLMVTLYNTNSFQEYI